MRKLLLGILGLNLLVNNAYASGIAVENWVDLLWIMPLIIVVSMFIVWIISYPAIKLISIKIPINKPLTISLWLAIGAGVLVFLYVTILFLSFYFM